MTLIHHVSQRRPLVQYHRICNQNVVSWSTSEDPVLDPTFGQSCGSGSFVSFFAYYFLKVRGASKIKLKKVNKKRTVTVRRLIIFLNISRRPLLICLQCCLHQYKTLKAMATATAAIVLLTPAKNLKKVFLGFLVVSPLFNHFLG